MNSEKGKQVLISGASFAGLSTAYWLTKLGYKVTIVEVANALRRGGTAVNIRGNTVDIVKRMGIFEQIKANRLNLEVWEFKNADDVTERSMLLRQEGEPLHPERRSSAREGTQVGDHALAHHQGEHQGLPPGQQVSGSAARRARFVRARRR